MRPDLARLFGAACLVAIALGSGCGSAAERSPKAVQTVVLSPERATDVQTATGCAVRVVLPGPEAGSGYAWEIVSNNTRVLEQMGPLRRIPGSGAQGSAATTTVSFFSLKPGRSVIRFCLLRPGEREAVPAAKCTLTASVDE